MNAAFRQSIADRTATIAVVGLGYVGMPLAIAFGRTGFEVIGFDVDSDRVAKLQAGRSYLMDISADEVQELVASGHLRPTDDPATLAGADVIFVCVPTPFDRSRAPDLRYIEAAARSIAAVLRPGELILLESTTYPGTTEEILVPILETSGLKAGADFFVAFSPERIDPGNKQFGIENTPKVVGGIDPESTARAAMVLQQVVGKSEVRPVSTPRVAEFTKLLENTFRAVNIALVNELTMLCDRMGIDIWEVIEAAKTKPYGFMPFYPGPGVGGHCIPVDPYYLSWKAREFDFSTKFIEIAAEINLEMPFFTVEKLRRALRERAVALAGAELLVLGAAFKRDTDDARNSSAIRVMEILCAEGARVRYHDPYVPQIRLASGLYGDHRDEVLLRSIDLTDSNLREADCVVILVGHSSVDHGRVVESGKLVFDAVNATAGRASNGRLVRL